MNEAQLKNRIGLFLIGSHFLLVLLIVLFFLLGGFTFNQMTTAIALIVPIFSAFSAMIIKYFIYSKEHKSDSHKTVPKSFATVVHFVSITSVCFIYLILLMKVFNAITFEQFKLLVGLTETCFGLYFGMVLASLYELKVVKCSQLLLDQDQV